MQSVEAAKYILKLWTDPDLGPDDFHAAEIMLRLVMLGAPVSTSDVLLVARAYCDSETENRTMGCKPKPGKPRPKAR